MKYIDYIVKIIILLVYVIFSKNSMFFPESFNVLVWIIFVINVLSTNFVLGMVHTASCFKNIYLSIYQRNKDESEDDVKVDEDIYFDLLPGWIFTMFIVGKVLEYVAFGLMLYYQGIILAIITEVAIVYLFIFLPKRYDLFMRSIYTYLSGLEKENNVNYTVGGYRIRELKNLFEKAINEKLNPRVWMIDLKEAKANEGSKSGDI